MASSKPSINPLAIIIADESMNLNSETKPKKTNGGRIKIPIEKIMNKNKMHVTFSKRRKGLFKKATELCVLCDASIAIITFSEAGKVFAFGYPSTDTVIHRYLNGSAIENPFEDRPIEELGLEELESYAESLKQTLFDLERRQ